MLQRRGQAFLASFRPLPARFPLSDKLGLGLKKQWVRTRNVKVLQEGSLLRTDTYRYLGQVFDISHNHHVLSTYFSTLTSLRDSTASSDPTAILTIIVPLNLALYHIGALPISLDIPTPILFTFTLFPPNIHIPKPTIRPNPTLATSLHSVLGKSLMTDFLTFDTLPRQGIPP